MKMNNEQQECEYVMVCAENHIKLSNKVSELINNGYELYGSPFFDDEFYQAVIKTNPT